VTESGRKREKGTVTELTTDAIDKANSNRQQTVLLVARVR